MHRCFINSNEGIENGRFMHSLDKQSPLHYHKAPVNHQFLNQSSLSILTLLRRFLREDGRDCLPKAHICQRIGDHGEFVQPVHNQTTAAYCLYSAS